MTTMVTARLGDKGRLVVPGSLRTRRGWAPGTELVFVEDAEAVRLMSAAEALRRFRDSVAGTSSPVDDLIAERRRAAEAGN